MPKLNFWKEKMVAHEIDFTTGLPAIAYRGEVPWHGFGQQINEDIPLDQWQSLAGLDWKVRRCPIYTNLVVEQDSDFAEGGLGRTRIPNKVALIRSDSQDLLSVVSDRYKVVQPAKVLEFFGSLIEKNGFEMHTAGALRGGKRVWALAKTGRGFKIGDDEVGAFLLLATSYDGTFSTTAQFTSIRVVCNNTLSWSLEAGDRQSDGIIKIPHNQEFDEVSVKLGLGLDVDWERFQQLVQRLTERKVTEREALKYFFAVLGVTEEQGNEGEQYVNVKKLLSFYQSGPGAQLPSAQGTAWGLVNAVTFFCDHSRRAKDAGSRFDSASFGSGALIKRKALTLAVALTDTDTTEE